MRVTSLRVASCIRQHTSAYVAHAVDLSAGRLLHTSAYVSIRRACGRPLCGSLRLPPRPPQASPPAYVSLRQHTSAYVSIRQHTSAYVSISQHTSAYVSTRQRTRQHTSAYVSICQLTSAYVSLRQLTPAHVSTRQHTSAHVSIRQHASPLPQTLLLSL
jgi:hypothetical protein